MLTPMEASGTQGLRGFILSVGDELISGLTVDTNSAWLSLRLAEAGVRVVGHATVGDDQPAIERAIARSAAGVDLLIVTGGIGPTPDDLTREALAAVMGAPLIEHPEWIQRMEAFFQERGRVMQPGNRKQATIPRGTKLLWNPTGTAAGIEADIPPSPPAARASCRLVVLPGVPAEMRAMYDQHVHGWAQRRSQERGGRVMRMRALHTIGLGESEVAARLDELLRRRAEEEGLQVGTTASRGIVSIRSYAIGEPAHAEAMLDAAEAEARRALGHAIFGRDDQTLAEVVGELLRSDPRRPVVTVAESCTGGLLARLITDVPGSSDYFDQGFITYSNEAKTRLLGVPEALIARQGAVSEPVAAAMAQGALERRGSDRAGVALAISGVAGPGGGTDEKPVGTVCLALAATFGPDGAGTSIVQTHRFPGDRGTVRRRSADMALAMLRTHLLKSPA